MNQTPYVRLFVAVAKKRAVQVDNVTTSDVANELGISVQLLSNWRRRGIATSKVNEVCQKLGISESWLENGFEKKTHSFDEVSSVLDNDFTTLTDSETSSFLNKIREKITPIFDRISSSKESRQQSLENLFIEVENRVKKQGLLIYRTPGVFGLNIKQWAKLSFLIVAHDGDSVFLSIIPKGVIPTLPDDTDEFIYLNESHLNHLETKLSKKFSMKEEPKKLSEKEKLILCIQESELDSTEIDFFRSVIENDSLKSLNLSKLSQMISVLHEITESD
jgi:predicted site-specific integrase-resolvase